MVDYLSKKDKKELVGLVRSLRVDDEDSVWDVGVELLKWSVKLRASIIKED